MNAGAFTISVELSFEMCGKFTRGRQMKMTMGKWGESECKKA